MSTREASFILAMTLSALPVFSEDLQSTANKCDCGPDYCLDDSRYPKVLAEKKKSLTKKGYPSDLIALIDRDGACVARVEQSPDGFSLRRIYRDGSMRTDAWTKENESEAKQELSNGDLKEYYKFNVDRAFSCCNEPKYDKRTDWDSVTQLNTGLAIKCQKATTETRCR